MKRSGAQAKAKTKTLVGSARVAATKVGILGGGQLARMLALSAHSMGLQPWIFSDGAEDPAAQVVGPAFHWAGSLSDENAVAQFLAQVDLATFESEFVDCEMLARLVGLGSCPLWPEPQLMGRLQDRLRQKQILVEAKLPVLPSIEVQTTKEAELAWREFAGEVVFKVRRGGYDGYGTFVVSSRSQLNKFCEQLEREASTTNYGFIAEPRIRFRRELACIAVRTRLGQVQILPLVESHQLNSRCLWVKGPVTHPGWPTVRRRLAGFLAQMDYVGAMGIEMFDTNKGLCVNELAPRVHNTGHYSLEALRESQFSLHLKAILGAEIAPPQLNAKGFAMMNLLGEGVDKPEFSLPSFVHLHWYGKGISRWGRKMGHYTVLAASASRALEMAKKVRSEFCV